MCGGILRSRPRGAVATAVRAGRLARRCGRPYDLPVQGSAGEWQIETVREQDLPDLLPLMRGYCSFYRVSPSDEALLALSRALISDVREGMQLLAREPGGGAIGFATVYWSWSTSVAGRIGIMNDLYVQPAWRGRRVAERLIGACAAECKRVGAVALEWQTAPDNVTAQRLYDRIGGRRESWLSYTLPIGPER
jgi:GNAT superfamily N-acetyltransferase